MKDRHMATVYITQELTKNIHRVIHRMRDNEVESSAPDCDRSITVNAAEMLNRLAWGDHYHLMSQLPKDWLRQPSGADINVITDTTEDGEQTKFAVSFSGLTGYYERPTADRWGAPRPECTQAWLEQHMQFTGAFEAMEKLKVLKNRKEIHEKWDKTFGDISTFLSKCKSLNEGLKVWPGLQLYIPSQYMDRINTKVERKARAEQLVADVDLEELTAAAIAAKLSGVSA